ncbi:hypothetical protein DFH09DRAFT_1263180 [Mycena vulgaris]|nr:hypothetical protein DFH09DRAFT_1263180 [Mycena vulgaris]
MGSFHDFLAGNGRGLVINPFVGKTLTVEATSEYLRKPLYVVSAGDLGIDPAALDTALTKIFRSAPAWGAVVLIDETDVFLEERGAADVTRNAMVAFDPAFQSRIHLSLHYRALLPRSKEQLWFAFLEKTRKTGQALQKLSVSQFEELSRLGLNGRQIKNAVKLSAALAAHKKKPLSYEHIQVTLNATDEEETRDTRN